MNYESPELYEMTLDGKLLRQFTTAQQPSVTSHDIAIDCDNHIYVLEGLGAGSRKLFEYAPDGTLVRHAPVGGAGHGRGDQSARQRQDALHAQLRRRADRVRVPACAWAIRSDGPLPRLVRPLRYRPEEQDIVITNGQNRFNRPLYGTNSAFFVYAGDKPEFLLSLPGKGGTLWLGIVDGWVRLLRMKRTATWRRAQASGCPTLTRL